MTEPRRIDPQGAPANQFSDFPDPIQAKTCPTANCHAPGLGPIPQEFSTPDWFAESAKKPKGVTPLFAPDVTALVPPPPANAPTAANHPPTPGGLKPEQAKAFSTEGANQENLAKKSTNPAQAMAHWQAAAFNFQMAGDIDGAKRALGQIKVYSEKIGNPLGGQKADAELALLDGRFAEALKNFRVLEAFYQNPSSQIDPEERRSSLTEINLKISLTLQVMAGNAAKEKKFHEAQKYLEEALLRTPSEELTKKTVAFYIQFGGGNLAKLEKSVHDLELKIAAKKSQPCNTNCHKPNGDPINWQDLDGLPSTFSDPTSQFYNPMAQWNQGPNLSAYQGLKHLSDAKKLELYYLETEDLPAAKQALDNAKAHLAWLVRSGMGPLGDDKSRIARERLVAEAFVAAGDTAAAIQIYQDLLASLDQSGLAKDKVNLTHELATLYLQRGMHEYQTRGVTTLDFSKAQELLDKAFTEIQSWSDAKEKKFFSTQNRFLSAEIKLTLANTPEEVDAAQAALEAVMSKYPRDLWDEEDDNPRVALLGRVQLRLAQVYFSRKDHHYKGDSMVRDILREFPQDAYLVSSARFAQALAKIQTSEAVDGLKILREIQETYPGSEADQAIRSSKKFSGVRGSDGLIKKDVKQSDIGEALKVALDRSGDTPGWRKAGFAGAGALIAAILAPEVTIPVLLVGGGAGLMADRAIGVAEHWNDITDAYQTGFSDVDMQRNLFNLFMLGLDVTMLVGAGLVGRGARGLAQLGLSRGAVGVSRMAPGLGAFFVENRVAAAAARGMYYLIPAATDASVAYTTYQGSKSLLLGEEFHWDPKEAMLMFALCESFAAAHRLGVGAKLSTNAKFLNGKLSPVIDAEGKLIGFTNNAGKAVGWATDAVIGATGYYGLLLGLDYRYGLPGGVPRYDEFLVDQLKTLGALHLGGKLAGKAGGAKAEAWLRKMDKQSQENLAAARKNIEDYINNRPTGGFFGGLQLVDASNGMTFGWRALPAPNPNFMMNENLNGNTKGTPANGESGGNPKRLDLLEELKKQLDADAQMRVNLGRDYRFLEALSPDQVETLYRLGKISVGNNENFLFYLLKNPEHAVRNFKFLTSLDPAAAKGLQQLSRVGDPSDSTSLLHRFFRSPWLFETPEGVAPNSGVTRGRLVLQAIAHLEGTPGLSDALQRITQEQKTDAGHWTAYTETDRPQWRGFVDELIRLGSLAAAGKGTSAELIAINKDMGRITYWRNGNPKDSVTHEMEADGIREDKQLEEAKSTYTGGQSGTFSFDKMSEPERFKNQANKYAQAIREGKIDGVIYRITAKNITPEVLKYLQDTIPNVTIYRYENIADTKGKLELKQKKIERLPSKEKFMAWQKDNMVFIQGDKIVAFEFPKNDLKNPDAKELIGLALHEFLEADPNAPQAAKERFKGQIAWAEKLLESLPNKAAQDALEKEILRLAEEAVAKGKASGSPRAAMLEAGAQLQSVLLQFAQKYGAFAGETKLGAKATFGTVEPSGLASGKVYLYLTAREFGSLKRVLSGNWKGKPFEIKKGTLLFGNGYTSIEMSNLKKQSGGGDYLLSFESAGALPLEMVTLPDGTTAFRVTADKTIRLGEDLNPSYFGENPHLDLFKLAQ